MAFQRTDKFKKIILMPAAGERQRSCGLTLVLCATPLEKNVCFLAEGRTSVQIQIYDRQAVMLQCPM